jgi:hypothetical protein
VVAALRGETLLPAIEVTLGDKNLELDGTS